MAFPRRHFLKLVAGAAARAVTFWRRMGGSVSNTVDHSGRDIPAGSAPDIIARLAAQYMSERLGQNVIVENKPGAGGNIATEYVAHSSPDGYTLLMPVSTNAVNIALYRNLPFDFQRDIEPIAGIAKTAFVIVTAASFREGPSRSSSPTSRPTRARSTWHRAASAPRRISEANCSRSRPAPRWSTCRIAATT